MALYAERDNRATLDRKAAQARDRRARKKERSQALTILNGMKPLRVQEAITRAYRSESTTTKDGTIRRYRIGAHVAAMCRQLIHWEGRGEAEGDWIHKTGFEWEHSEAGLTTSMLRTARRIASEEDLIEEKQGTRRDKRATVYYRLDLWRVAQVVVESELEKARTLLASEGRDEHKAKLRKEIRNLEATKDDLALRNAPDVTPSAPVSTSGTPHGYGENGQADCETQAQGPPTPANLAGYPCQNRAPTVEDPSKVPFTSDSSRGGSSVASSSPTPSRMGSSDDGHHEGHEETTYPEYEHEAYDALYDQLSYLLRGEGGKNGEDIIGPLVMRHLAGDAAVSFGRLVGTVRGFVRLPEDGVDLDGLVGQVLDEVRTEEIGVEERIGEGPDTLGDEGDAKQGGAAHTTAEVDNDGTGDTEERPVLPNSLKMSVIRIVLPIWDENEASQLADRYAVGEEGVTAEQVAEKVGELLPPESTLPLKDITVVVEGLFAVGRGESP
jgi:hypothetical protein